MNRAIVYKHPNDEPGFVIRWGRNEVVHDPDREISIDLARRAGPLAKPLWKQRIVDGEDPENPGGVFANATNADVRAAERWLVTRFNRRGHRLSLPGSFVFTEANSVHTLDGWVEDLRDRVELDNASTMAWRVLFRTDAPNRSPRLEPLVEMVAYRPSGEEAQVREMHVGWMRREGSPERHFTFWGAVTSRTMPASVLRFGLRFTMEGLTGDDSVTIDSISIESGRRGV